VSIDVAYAGLNFAEVMGRRGDLGVQSNPFVPGLEVSGRVRALGAGVSHLRTGQPVCAFTDTGGYAQVAIASAVLTFPVPGDDDDALLVAACAPTIGVTAWSLLRYAGRMAQGEALFVHAAAGGLGTLVGQFARHLGAGRIVGTVGTAEKRDYARRFGYDDVMLRDEFLARACAVEPVDVVLDSVGGRTRARSLEVLKPYGRLVACGNASRSENGATRGGDLMGLNVSLVGYSIGNLAARAPERVRDAGIEALPLIFGGQVRIDVTEVLDFDAIRAAHERLEAGHTRGKLALRIGA
jgi:NADPH2:quinone reductase